VLFSGFPTVVVCRQACSAADTSNLPEPRTSSINLYFTMDTHHHHRCEDLESNVDQTTSTSSAVMPVVIICYSVSRSESNIDSGNKVL
jgi:hypothetical protein